MTKKRILTAAAAMTLTLGLGAGIAAAQTDPSTPTRPPEAGTMHDGDMHDGDMDAMHAQMPEDMRAQCDTMNAQGGMTNGTMSGPMMDGEMMDGGMTAQS